MAARHCRFGFAEGEGPKFGIYVESETGCVSGIYKITCILTGKYYIGSAEDIKTRWWGHLRSLRGNGRKHHSQYLLNAWNKYGPEAFDFQVIEWVYDLDYLLAVEQEYLDNWRPWDREIGFNTSRIAGSTRGIVHSEESRRKRSERAIAVGMKPSEECLRLATEAKLGKKDSEETRKKKSESHVNLSRSEEHCSNLSKALIGKTRTDESKKKQSETRIRKIAEGNIPDPKPTSASVQKARDTYARNRLLGLHKEKRNSRSPVSDETRQKQSEAAIRRRARERANKLLIILDHPLE